MSEVCKVCGETDLKLSPVHEVGGRKTLSIGDAPPVGQTPVRCESNQSGTRARSRRTCLTGK